MSSRAAGPLVLALALSAPVYSAASPGSSAPPQSTGAQTAAAQDEEEAFDEKLREFGYWSGAAYNCVSDTKQPEVERQVIETYDGIAKLFGTDRAFFYAASFGRGTAQQIDKVKCLEFLERFQKATALRGGRR